MHSVQSAATKSKYTIKGQRKRRFLYINNHQRFGNHRSHQLLFNNDIVNNDRTIHGIVVSNLSLVLLQKEYIEQFYFEKRSGGGGPHTKNYKINLNLMNLMCNQLEEKQESLDLLDFCG